MIGVQAAAIGVARERANPAVRRLLDLFAPSLCAGCRAPRSGLGGGGVCATCWGGLPTEEPRCPRCALPGEGLCRDCLTDPPPFTAASCLGDYGGALARIVAALKFRGLDIAARPAAIRLVAAARRVRLLEGLDGVTPAPSTRRRNRDRGYDQARLLAAEIARRSALPLVEALERRGDATPQSALPATARRGNVAGAFAAIPAKARGKRLVLVDDVMTTGATVRAASSALLDAGALEVRLLVLARTP